MKNFSMKKGHYFAFIFSMICVCVSLTLFSQEPPPDDQDCDYDEFEYGAEINIICGGGYGTPCGGTKSNQYCTSCNSRFCESSSNKNSYCTTTIRGTTGHFHCFGGYKKSGSGAC